MFCPTVQPIYQLYISILSQYLLDDGSLSNVGNVEYHFLPGEHQVPANTVLKNLYNFFNSWDCL